MLDPPARRACATVARASFDVAISLAHRSSVARSRHACRAIEPIA
jgi:hypothetical protein